MFRFSAGSGASERHLDLTNETLRTVRGGGRPARRRGRQGCTSTRPAVRNGQRAAARFLLFTTSMMMKQRLVYIAVPLFAIVSAAGPVRAEEGRAWGDIHIQTLDGASYEFQAGGEFVASRATAGDFEVQLRLESAGFGSYVSTLTAVAVLVDTSRASVALGREPMLSVEEQPVTLLPGEGHDLPEGGRIERSPKGYEIVWKDGSSLSVSVSKRHLNAFLRPAVTRRGTLSGLFGNFNGNSADDIDVVTAIGAASGSALEASVAEFARSLFSGDDHEWLVSQPTSLFEYAPGQNTRTFRKPMPKREASTAGLPPSWRRRARATCEQAGVTDPDLLEACIVDVGYTRDESFAETAAAVQARSRFDGESDLDRRPH